MMPVKDLGTAGFIADQAGYELPPAAFTLVRNVRMYRGWAERIGGHAQVFSSTAVVPYYVQAHSSATINYIVHAGLAAVYVDDGTTRTDITGTVPTGAIADRWTGGTFGGLLILNNSVDSPMYWDNNTANNLATLTGWTAGHKAKALRPFKNFILALNYTKAGVNYPHGVKWSDSADPGSLPASWDHTDPTNDAGESPALAETPDVIVDGLPLGDMFVVYKERSMYGMQLIGGNDIFRFFRLPGDSGMLARGCAAATPMGHVVLTQGDVVLHNGQGPRSIIDSRARRWLFSLLDPDNYARSFVVAHPQKQEVWVCFPSTGQSVCNKALVWNWADDVVSTRDLPSVTYACFGVVNAAASTFASVTGTFASITGTFSDYAAYSVNDVRLFLANSASMIFVADAGGGEAGVAFEATIERTGLHFDMPDTIKLCRGVWPKIDGTTGTIAYVQIGASMYPQVDPTWQTAQAFTIGTSTKIDGFAAGRYLAYRITSTSTSPWRIRSLDFDITLQGKF